MSWAVWDPQNLFGRQYWILECDAILQNKFVFVFGIQEEYALKIDLIV